VVAILFPLHHNLDYFKLIFNQSNTRDIYLLIDTGSAKGEDERKGIAM
jgi:hypothetical protein